MSSVMIRHPISELWRPRFALDICPKSSFAASRLGAGDSRKADFRAIGCEELDIRISDRNPGDASVRQCKPTIDHLVLPRPFEIVLPHQTAAVRGRREKNKRRTKKEEEKEWLPLLGSGSRDRFRNPDGDSFIAECSEAGFGVNRDGRTCRSTPILALIGPKRKTYVTCLPILDTS